MIKRNRMGLLSVTRDGKKETEVKKEEAKVEKKDEAKAEVKQEAEKPAETKKDDGKKKVTAASSCGRARSASSIRTRTASASVTFSGSSLTRRSSSSLPRMSSRCRSESRSDICWLSAMGYSFCCRLGLGGPGRSSCPDVMQCGTVGRPVWASGGLDALDHRPTNVGPQCMSLALR